MEDPGCAEVLKRIQTDDQLLMILTNPKEPCLQREILPESPESVTKTAQPRAIRSISHAKSQTQPKLVVGNEHIVTVIGCYDGPRNFYVRFLNTENVEKYKAFKESLNKALLNPLKTLTQIGAKCITLSAQNDQKELEAYRIVVKQIRKKEIRITLIDEGRDLIVLLPNLYSTQDQVFDTPPFATNFTLEGAENVYNHLSKSVGNFYFLHLTRHQNLKLTIKAISENGL